MTVKHYAQQLAAQLREIETIQEAIKDIVASAKDAGINPRALRKVAREMCIDASKRAKIYDDEYQLEMFRTEVGLVESYAEAAE